MPEMLFHLRWPDGRGEACYSPSLVIKDFFAPGEAYPVADFLERSRTALAIASDRVQARYGMPCARARAQLARIEAASTPFLDHPDARVTVVAFDE
ncbi:MSMEG_0570 family nitrogen starvation response protein [Chelatococcus reniformis]|uniref:MSMEG_0570 family nitrogen starvation response protein n=1 Tax=Chelatococcus reniformis TaxID=1494448 RepID=A0A916TWR0_9HYPH|nr:MSMEG_0570 family nitrogen starvation response protein [Chelatococcus reniformis]GGC47911.1 hypothetical protein GCM10010994_03840 [Chelatococcus reniformis]